MANGKDGYTIEQRIRRFTDQGLYIPEPTGRSRHRYFSVSEVVIAIILEHLRSELAFNALKHLSIALRKHIRNDGFKHIFYWIGLPPSQVISIKAKGTHSLLSLQKTDETETWHLLASAELDMKDLVGKKTLVIDLLQVLPPLRPLLQNVYQ